MATSVDRSLAYSLPTSAAAWNIPSARPAIRLLLADEHALVRQGIAAMMEREAGLEVVGEAASGAEAMELYRRHRPDVLALDLLLPDVPGDEVARRILAEFPGARILIITAARGDVHLLRAVECGVKGVVLKGMCRTVLVDAIRQVHAGRKVVPRQVASTLAEHFGDDALSPREVQVLRLVANGNRNKQVAGELGIADETVRMHMKNILSKLAANDRTHAVTIALKRGIFQL